jgi:predicted DNA binding CopG/RHH family protein
MSRARYLAHAASPQERENLAGTHSRAGGKGHGGRILFARKRDRQNVASFLVPLEAMTGVSALLVNLSGMRWSAGSKSGAAQSITSRRFPVDSVMRSYYDLHHMRTTISLNDRLAEQVRRRAAKEGLSVSAFIAKTLDDAMKRQPAPEMPPFRLITVKGEGAHPDIDLDRPRSLEVQEDEAVFSRRVPKS